MADLVPDETLDCIGLYCPVPVIKTKEAIDRLRVGEVLEVLADDPAAPEDMRAWAKRTGHELLAVDATAEGARFLIRKAR